MGACFVTRVLEEMPEISIFPMFCCVQVQYEELDAIMSIDDAIKAGSFHSQYDRTICNGDVDMAFEQQDVACIVEGEARMGGQEHFYLEPHCNFVEPLESDEFLLVASTQVCLCMDAR
jgi:xanthine dehydrogenase/oxidase